MGLCQSIKVGPYVETRCNLEKAKEYRAAADARIEGDLCVPPVEEFQGEVTIWLSNRRILNRPSIEPEQATATDVTPALIEEELRTFHMQHGAELAILRNVYGEFNVRVHWGVLNYVS